MTRRQRHERISFELRHLRWQALQRGYSPRELEQQLVKLVDRFDMGADQAWLRETIADFRATMAREMASLSHDRRS